MFPMVSNGNCEQDRVRKREWRLTRRQVASVIRIVTIVGARPQFVKAAAVSRAFSAFNRTRDRLRLEERIIHTGQHYDHNMSKVFFDELSIPRPALDLQVGSGTHGAQTAAMLERIEKVLIDERPDWVLVYGDTNSTLAGALAAAKLQVPLAHVEAGLRSFNLRMPEEINRVLTDHVSQLRLCPTVTAVRNLAAEGITQGVHEVGDVMYDSVLYYSRTGEKHRKPTDRLGLLPKQYYLATVHREENTDDPVRLGGIFDAFQRVQYPVVLPLHPRTRKALRSHDLSVGGDVRIIDPASYLDTLLLERDARLILTDSGGIQKEAYWFSVPCVTLRDETEWIELVEAGCNRLVGADPAKIVDAVSEFEGCTVTGQTVGGPSGLYGDGHSAEKIVEILARLERE